MANDECLVCGCHNKYHAKGYCGKHYHRLVKYGDPTYIPARSRLVTPKECIVQSCNKKPVSFGLCSSHLRSQKLYGDPLWVQNNPKINKRGREGEYRTYHSMLQRCYNENNIAYKNYGGRGIIVCDSWRVSFDNFYNDMGSKPSSKHEIDRIDNEKGYSKQNCRWATGTENRRNTRSVKLSLAKASLIRKANKEGESITKLSKRYEVCRSTIKAVIENKTWRNK